MFLIIIWISLHIRAFVGCFTTNHTRTNLTGSSSDYLIVIISQYDNFLMEVAGMFVRGSIHTRVVSFYHFYKISLFVFMCTARNQTGLLEIRKRMSIITFMLILTLFLKRQGWIVTRNCLNRPLWSLNVTLATQQKQLRSGCKKPRNRFVLLML